MHQLPEPEEALPDGLRRALNDTQEAWAAMLFSEFSDASENYGVLLGTVIDLIEYVPADRRDEVTQLFNGTYPMRAVTMNSVVRLASDYDDINDALAEFFRTFGIFRHEFVRNGSLRTLIWASKEMNEALAECTSFYHVEFSAAEI